MKRTVLISAALFSLIVFGFLAWQAMQPPEGVHLEGSTAKVTAYAMLDQNQPEETYVMLDSIPAPTLRWLDQHGYEAGGFEPHTQLGYGDTLNFRHPYYIGFKLFNKQE